MLILLILMIIVGFWHKQNISYWKAVAVSGALQWISALFFTAKTGVISSLMGEDYWYVSFLLAMTFSWGIPIYLYRKTYKKPITETLGKQ